MAGIQKRVRDSCDPTKPGFNGPCGAYPQVLRSNVDQVPFNFGMNGRDTLDYVGTERVTINTGNTSDNKRMGTLQVWLFNLPKAQWHLQPRITIVFRGKGGKYYDKERSKYHKGVDVLFQPKVRFNMSLLFC
jgi:hypothetical protein